MFRVDGTQQIVTLIGSGSYLRSALAMIRFDRLQFGIAVFPILATGCVSRPTYYAPGPQTARPAVMIGAPFDRTWEAVIDLFARSMVPIETLERASGLIVATRAVVPTTTPAQRDAALELANCGVIRGGVRLDDVVYYPTSARYNVVVRARGDSSSSLQVTAAFVGRIEDSGRTMYPSLVECSSRGTFEAMVEETIKARAEGPPL